MEDILEGATRDVVLAADSLIGEFGSVPAALAGSGVRLRRSGVDELVIRRIESIRRGISLLAASRIEGQPLLSTFSALRDYLSVRLRFEINEQVLVLFLDGRQRLMIEEIMWTGTVDEVAIFVRPLLHRALDVGASSIILVHNHPAGDPTPSVADERITSQVAAAGRSLGITLLDHIIVAREGMRSFRAMGRL